MHRYLVRATVETPVCVRDIRRLRDPNTEDDPPWSFNPAFDLNKDGRINVGDNLLVAKNSGGLEPHDPHAGRRWL